MHRRAHKGSGGVGFLIKDAVNEEFDITVLDDSHEDILWLGLKSKRCDVRINACVGYLSPQDSSRNVDPHDFYECLLSHIYMYQNDGACLLPVW